MSNPILNAEQFQHAVASFSNTVEEMRLRVCSEMQGAADQHYTAAKVFESSVNRLVRAMGMQAENDQRKAVGASMAYTEDAFANL